MLRKEAHSAQRKMAADAAALRRECAPSAHFFTVEAPDGAPRAKTQRLTRPSAARHPPAAPPFLS